MSTSSWSRTVSEAECWSWTSHCQQCAADNAIISFSILTMLRARIQQIVRFFKSQRFPTLRKMMSSTRTLKFHCGYSLCTSHQTGDPRATQHRLDGLQRFRHASSSFSVAEHHHAIFLQLFVIIGALAKSTRTFAAPSPRRCCTSPRPARVSNAMRSFVDCTTRLCRSSVAPVNRQRRSLLFTRAMPSQRPSLQRKQH